MTLGQYRAQPNIKNIFIYDVDFVKPWAITYNFVFGIQMCSILVKCWKLSKMQIMTYFHSVLFYEQMSVTKKNNTTLISKRILLNIFSESYAVATFRFSSKIGSHKVGLTHGLSLWIDCKEIMCIMSHKHSALKFKK